MMTATASDGIGFSCPAWCTGHDRMSEEGDPHPDVRHSRAVRLSFPDDERPKDRVYEVSPEVWHADDGTGRALVYFNDEGDGELLSAAEVRGFVDALTEASRLAFGPDPYGPERAELDAAVAEVAQRAGHLQDTNRLFAAVLRLREAYRVLNEVTR